MRLGLALPIDIPSIARAARSAEACGFDSLWVGEAYNRGFMLVDPFVALGIAAAVTDRVELGSSVLQIPLHGSFPLAVKVGSISAASQGRFMLGAGAGWNPGDFHPMGVDFTARFQLLSRTIDEMRRLLDGEEVDGSRLSPPDGLPRVPVLIGARRSSRWIRKAALDYDGWISSAASTDLSEMVEGLKYFRELADDQRAIAANLDGLRPDAGEILAALADAGFDDATVVIDRHDDESIERARQLWTG